MPEPLTAPPSLADEFKDAFAQGRHFMHGSHPAPEGKKASFVYGFSQPFFGLRVTFQDRSLLRAALIPTAALLGTCLLWAAIDAHTLKDFVRTFVLTLAGLSTVPSILFAAHYARMAATAYRHFGFGPCEGRVEGLRHALRNGIRGAVLVWLVAAPVLFLAGRLPGLGKALGVLIGGAWALHWVVVNALEPANVLRNGQTIDEAEAEEALSRRAWFVRIWDKPREVLPPPFRSILGKFVRGCDRLSATWRGDLAVVEDHPWASAGFAVSCAMLLAAPGLNVFFRPATVVAAVHFRRQLVLRDERVLAAKRGPVTQDAL